MDKYMVKGSHPTFKFEKPVWANNEEQAELVFQETVNLERDDQGRVIKDHGFEIHEVAKVAPTISGLNDTFK